VENDRGLHTNVQNTSFDAKPPFARAIPLCAPTATGMAQQQRPCPKLSTADAFAEMLRTCESVDILLRQQRLFTETQHLRDQEAVVAKMLKSFEDAPAPGTAFKTLSTSALVCSRCPKQALTLFGCGQARCSDCVQIGGNLHAHCPAESRTGICNVEAAPSVVASLRALKSK